MTTALLRDHPLARWQWLWLSQPHSCLLSWEHHTGDDARVWGLRGHCRISQLWSYIFHIHADECHSHSTRKTALKSWNNGTEVSVGSEQEIREPGPSGSRAYLGQVGQIQSIRAYKMESVVVIHSMRIQTSQQGYACYCWMCEHVCIYRFKLPQVSLPSLPEGMIYIAQMGFCRARSWARACNTLHVLLGDNGFTL